MPSASREPSETILRKLCSLPRPASSIRSFSLHRSSFSYAFSPLEGLCSDPLVSRDAWECIQRSQPTAASLRQQKQSTWDYPEQRRTTAIGWLVTSRYSVEYLSSC